MDELKKDKDLKEEKTSSANGKTDQSEKKKSAPRRKKVADLEAEVQELKHDLLRNQADFENFKKRINQERIQDRKYAGMDIIHDLLIPIDQLNKVVSMEVSDEVLKNYLLGFKMINDQIYQTLEDNGVTPIKSIGEKFDPKVHYAVEKDSNKELENGIITEEIQKGYMYKDRIIRPAMVKVNEWSD